MPAPDPLTLTGERTLPGMPGEQYWFARHECAYAWVARRYAAGARVVVDAGAGEGYGAAALAAAGAGLVLAVDYDRAVTRHVAAAYPRLSSVRANLDALPLRAGTTDLLVALQVVEHLWDVPRFLREGRRVLRPGATLVLATPNRPVFSPALGRGERPLNPFHAQEYDADELAGLVSAQGFSAVQVAGVQHGPRIRAWEQAYGTGIVAAQLAALAPDPPGPDPSGFVATVRTSDFVVGGADGAQDLLLTATAP